jgi:two-component system, NarL family, nitrate/nitrite response regulator NarL
MLPPVSFPDANAERVLGDSARRAESTMATEELQHALGGGLSSRPPRAVRILVVDDHEGFRSSMVQALDLVPDVEVAGEARSGQEACEIVLTLKPDVVLLDLSMPGMDAMDATRQIRRVNPSSQVVVLSAFDGPQIEQAALAAGAWGLVPKGTPLEDVVGVLLNAAEQPRAH